MVFGKLRIANNGIFCGAIFSIAFRANLRLHIIRQAIHRETLNKSFMTMRACSVFP